MVRNAYVGGYDFFDSGEELFSNQMAETVEVAEATEIATEGATGDGIVSRLSDDSLFVLGSQRRVLDAVSIFHGILFPFPFLRADGGFTVKHPHKLAPVSSTVLLPQ